MSRKPKDTRVGPWAAEKLDALRRALSYYTTRLKKQPQWDKIYVDAFAGPGLSEVRTRSRKPEEQSTLLFSDNAADPIE